MQEQPKMPLLVIAMKGPGLAFCLLDLLLSNGLTHLIEHPN
jgi:hypothetical protein